MNNSFDEVQCEELDVHDFGADYFGHEYHAALPVRDNYTGELVD